MTQEQAQKWWPEIEALKAGKTIQTRYAGIWFDDPVPQFSEFGHTEHRVKPEPREFWFFVDKNVSWGGRYMTEADAKARWENIHPSIRGNYEIIHVREVL